MEKYNNCVVVQNVTLSDIEAMVNRAVDKRIAAFYEKVRPKPPVLVKRKEAAKYIGVSLPTLDAYAKYGLLHPQHMGGRVFYSEDELEAFRGSPGLRP